MKILWLAPGPYPNTNEHPAPWISSLAREIVKEKDVDLTIVRNSKFVKGSIEYFKKDNISYVFLRSPRGKLDLLTLYQIRIGRMKSYLRKNYGSFDLINIFGSEHQFEVSSYGVSLPQILTIQGIMSECVKVLSEINWQFFYWNLQAFYEKKYLKKIKNFFCFTRWDKAFIKSINPEARIYHASYMIRPEFFEDHFSPTKDKILFIGGTQYIKGFEVMLKTFDIVRKDMDLKLIFIGKADQRLVRQTVRRYRLDYIEGDDIEFRGYQDVQGILRAYDESFCLVHPSLIDNSPNAVCEAQIAGLPVIATNVGGTSSLIENRKTGLLCSLDPKDIAEKILEVCENDTFRRSISVMSKKIVRERHNAKKIVKNTLRVYKELIEA